MREIKKATTFTKIEFWAITTIFAFVFLFFFMEGLAHDQPPYESASYYPLFEQANAPFDYFKNYFDPQLIRHLGAYIALISLNFLIVPGVLKRSSWIRNSIMLILVFVALVLLYYITGTWLHGYRYASESRSDANTWISENSFRNAWMIIFQLAIYTAIKYAGVYLLGISEKIEGKYKFLRKEGIIATVIWLAGLLVLRFGRAETEIIVGWAIVVPSAIALYLFSFYKLIPDSLAKKRYPLFSYLKKCVLVLFAAFIIIYIISIFIIRKDDAGVAYSAFNAFFQLFITVPITWMLYKRHLKGNEEIDILQKELKRSSAKVDFLRSQINPHFLFNALNTLYGTAIQENADRTSAGIQKLGDMMRFMLQENMQDTISLSREIDYLENYISLQRLRTDPNPGVQIQTQIQSAETFLQVAPMLLIPFVENAFKHGISLREPSYIKLTLEIKDSTLYFDISNSKHSKHDNDPEKDKNGIGLENVQQRLKLFYPNKHELVIRDTPKEFFVHLTIQLAKFASS
jgi:two-component system LytT family sensor kinase